MTPSGQWTRRSRVREAGGEALQRGTRGPAPAGATSGQRAAQGGWLGKQKLAFFSPVGSPPSPTSLFHRPASRAAGRISHVLLCNVTQRVSFWFVVTDPSRNHTLPAVEVQSAIRMNRNRINNAFFLNDQTLEFLRIPATLAPPTDPSVPIWIIIFGVIFCIVIVATMLLILSGIRQHRRKNKGPSEMENTEDKWENTITIENGIPCDPLDMKGGHVNDAFVTEDERLTPL
eukprot:XP_028348383.1 collectrin [Physeter catodon]